MSTDEYEKSIRRAIEYMDRVIVWLSEKEERIGRFRDKFLISGLFSLAYYPVDITPVLKKWGELCEKVFPPIPNSSKEGREKIKLGIFSRMFFRQSVFFVFLRGLIKNIDRRFFEIIVFSSTETPDDMTEWVKENVDTYYSNRPKWREVLLDEACDVLFYPDTTMDALSVHYAMQRFSPLQITT